MDEAALVHVRCGALLHNIGKMGLPDSILLKPGQLAPEGWEIMRRHPIYANELLQLIGFLCPAIDIQDYYREKWDSTGYPHGLKHDEILLAARIFAVADVWDRLPSDRPYRSAWPNNKVRLHIQSQAVTHFDPHGVWQFLEPDF